MRDVSLFMMLLFSLLTGIVFVRQEGKEFRSELRSEVTRLKANPHLGMVEDHLRRMDASFRLLYHPTDKIESHLDAVSKRI